MTTLFSEYITSLDLFGSPIQVNYNKRGPAFKTLSGGSVSVLIKCFMLYVVVQRSYEMLARKNPYIERTESLIDMAELEQETKFNNTGLEIYFLIFSYAAGIPAAKSPDEVKEYVNIRVGQSSQDWNLNVFKTDYSTLVPCSSISRSAKLDNFTNSV